LNIRIQNKSLKVNILEAKNRLSQLIQSALAGEEIIIANRGNPVVRLVPIEPKEEETKPAKSNLHFSDWLKENRLPEHLKRNHAEIEQSIDSQRDSWD